MTSAENTSSLYPSIPPSLRPEESGGRNVEGNPMEKCAPRSSGETYVRIKSALLQICKTVTVTLVLTPPDDDLSGVNEGEKNEREKNEEEKNEGETLESCTLSLHHFSLRYHPQLNPRPQSSDKGIKYRLCYCCNIRPCL